MLEITDYWSMLLASLFVSLIPTIITVVVSKFPSYFIALCWVGGGLISTVITVSGNRAHLLNRHRWWLCTLEAAAVVLDKFIIMGIHAARSCRTMTKFSFFARHGGKKVASEAPETLECVRQSLVTFAALLAAMTCLAGLSTPDAFFLSDIQDDDEHLPGGRGPILRHKVALAFLCFSIMSSLGVLTLPMRRAVTGHGHSFCSLALWVFTDAALIGLMGVFAVWSRRSLTTSISFLALVVAVLLCTGLLVLAFLPKPVEKVGRNTEETLEKCSKQWDTADSEDHRDPALSATGICSESADPVVAEEDSNSPIKRTPVDATWRVASAAPHHMTGNQSLMLAGSYVPVHDGNDGAVIMVHQGTNGEAVPLQVRGRGSVRTESVTLDDVWYVPGLDSNLVSTGQLARQGCAVNLGPGGCSITSGGALVGTARFTEASQFELDYLKVA